MNQNKDWFTRSFQTYPKGSNEQSPSKQKGVSRILHEWVVIVGLGLDYCRRHFVFGGLLGLGLYILSNYVVSYDLHIHFLHLLEPKILTYDRLSWLFRFSVDVHLWTIFGLLCVSVLTGCGFRSRYIRTKYQKIFESVGLMTRLGQTPVLMHKRKLKHGRVQLEFDAKGVGKSRFEEKSEDLSSMLGESIESISVGEKPHFINLVLAKDDIPTKVTYQEIVAAETLPPNCFYAGMSTQGPIIQDITELPHLLIAGTTNSGKSVFLKQLLVGLLESSPHLQLYLIDLKQGIEAVDFKYAPNVKIAKTVGQAVDLLRELKDEMDSRFRLLEESNKKSIDPTRDGKPRIIIAVDESSVLYMKRHRLDPEAPLAAEARVLTDGLAKLSRAAGMHLILATQKLTAEVLPTTVTENISGRMCFRTKTLQGSLLVLGNSDAMDLPAIKGRGIWNFGNEQQIVQGAYISDKEIQNISKSIAEALKDQTHDTQVPMLGEKKSLEIKQTRKDIQESEKNNETPESLVE